MIKIEDYFTDETYARFDAIEKDVLANPEHLDKYLDIVSEENHNLLALALRCYKNSLADILIDKGIGINHIDGRSEHVILSAEGQYVTKILKSKHLDNKKLVYHHLIHHAQHSFIYNATDFAEQIEAFDLQKIDKKDLLALEVLVDTKSKQVSGIDEAWEKFKEKNNLIINPKDILIYLLEKDDEFKYRTYNKDNKSNKKTNQEISFLKGLIYYALEHDKIYKGNPFYAKWLKIYNTKSNIVEENIYDRINEKTRGKYFSIVYEYHKNKEDYLNKKLFYEQFKDVISYNSYACKKEEVDFAPLIKKYGLQSISFSGKYSPNLVYQFLDEQLNVIAEKFNIKPDILGANILNIRLESFLNKKEAEGKYSLKNKDLTIFCTMGVDTLLSYNVASINKFNLKYDNGKFLSTLAHEYTHFLQDLNDDIHFKKPLIFKQWEDIKKELSPHSKNECIEYLLEVLLNGKMKNTHLEKLLNKCFENFNTHYRKDKKYILAETNLIDYLSKDFNQYTDYFKVIIRSYHSQKKNSFQEQVWNHLDLKKHSSQDYKAYYNRPVEIHARIVQEVIFNDAGVQHAGLISINPLGRKDDTLSRIKPKLIAFNKMLTTNLELVAQQFEHKKLKPKTI